jgi:hypothetical protein
MVHSKDENETEIQIPLLQDPLLATPDRNPALCKRPYRHPCQQDTQEISQ